VKLLLLMALLACVPSLSMAETTGEVRYVTDQMWLQLRSGPSSGHRILQTLKTGTSLTILEEDKEKGYTHVQTSRGKEGWVLTRYLVRTPIARIRLAKAEETLSKLTAELGQTKTLLSDAQSTLEELRKEKSDLEQIHSTTSKELDQIKTLSSNAIELDVKSKKLTMRNQELEIQLEALTAENTELASDRDRTYLLYGGGLIVIGILAGLILPSLRARKGSNSSWA